MTGDKTSYSLFLMNELKNRTSEMFGLQLVRQTSWRVESLIEVIEVVIKQILECIMWQEWLKSFTLIQYLHEFLLTSEVALIEPYFVDSDKGKILNEIMSRSLMVTVIMLNRISDSVARINEDIVKEICVSFSTGLQSNRLWILDEVLLIASSRPQINKEEDCSILRYWNYDFLSELHALVQSYTSEYYKHTQRYFGKSTKFAITTWSEKKIQYISDAENQLNPCFTQINKLARMRNVEFDRYVKNETTNKLKLLVTRKIPERLCRLMKSNSSSVESN